jgi:hypothetical protein
VPLQGNHDQAKGAGHSVKKLAVWQVFKNSLLRVEEASLELEKHLESWIAEDPDLIQNGLRIVGRQVHLEAGPLDLLGIDPQGRWVAIELKRGELDRKAVAQVVDYAACLSTLSAEELREKVAPYLSKTNLTIDQLLEARGALHSLDPEQRQVLLVVVGTGSATGLQRVVSYLAVKHNLPISILLFHVFRLSKGQLLLAREVTEQETAVPSAGRGTKAAVSLSMPMALAKQHGLQASLQKALDLAKELGLHVRPYKTSVMFTPPSNGSRMLFTVWAKPEKGQIKAYVGIEPFTEFFPLRRAVVAQQIGAEGWRTFTPSSFVQFLRSVKKLITVAASNASNGA